MRMIVLITALLALAGGCTKNTANLPDSVIESHGSKRLYTVDKYVPARDASLDLAATVDRATSENKRVLIEVGGDW